MKTIINQPNEYVGVAGDWHSDLGWTQLALQGLKEMGLTLILHVGDFNFWPGQAGTKFLTQTNTTLKQNNQTILVTPGNHEDYTQISEMVPHPTLPGCVFNPKYPQIIVTTRGARITINNVSFVFLGGGNSIDREYRTENETWWRAEQITQRDIEKTVKGGYADVMVTHDCPTGVTLPTNHRSAKNWFPTQLEYAQKSRQMLRTAVDQVKPQILFHGHYHIYSNTHQTLITTQKEEYTFQSIGLNMNGTKENVGMFHLPSKDFTLIPVPGYSKYGRE